MGRTTYTRHTVNRTTQHSSVTQIDIDVKEIKKKLENTFIIYLIVSENIVI